MKLTRINALLLFIALVLLANVGCHTERTESELQAEAKISKADAEKTALARVPDGSVQEAELEEEDGQLIWSFDISRPGTKDITEVHVDAKTGAVIAVESETPKEQAKERD